MFRRSVRLQEAGYYTEEGLPSVSYKEKLFKVFQRRKNFDRGDQRNSTNHSELANQHDFIPDCHHLDDHQDASNNRDNDRDNRDATAVTSGTQTTLTSTTGTQGTQTRAHHTQTTGTWTHTSTSGTQATFTTTTATQTFRPKRKNVRTTRRSSLNIISRFLLLLALVFGFTYAYMQIRELQQEVQSLRQQIHMVFHLSDTLPNFASKSLGASVQASLSSDTYWSHGVWILDRLFYWWHTTNKQANVIQGNLSLHPGDCWPLSGNQGHLFITLSHPASITHVTLGHITKSQSPTGFIKSAPREFSVYGMKTTDDEGTYLGTSVYDQDGSAFQTFKLTNPDETAFRHVKLQINSNWGNLDNTCLYSFRVHGKLPA